MEENKEKELINRYRLNDELAQKTLIEYYTKFIWHLVHQELNGYYINENEYEDLFQEALVAFDQAVKVYDEKFNVPLIGIASVIIKRRLKRSIYNIIHYKASLNLVSLDSYLSEDNEERFIDFQSNVVKEDFDVSYLEYLNEKERKIIELRVQGYSYQEIANILNISPKKVDNDIQKIRRRMKTLL